jgi:two-component system sensor histidine kinase DegS
MSGKSDTRGERAASWSAARQPEADSRLDALERQQIRLAFDIHDGPAQALSACLLQLELIDGLADTDELPGEIDELRRLVEDALDGLRAMAAELRPSSLDANGLVPKIRQYLDQLTEHSGMRVGLKVDGAEQALSSSAQFAVFRVMQEALTNARVHGRADKAVVELDFGPDATVCSVIDDGEGFDPSLETAADERSGMGLVGMSERAALLGGSLDVASAPGEGTTVTLRIPVWR